MRRAWACLVAVVLALSLLLVPGTAVAQQDSTPVESVTAFDGISNGWVSIFFPENVSTLIRSSYSVTFDGVPQAIVGITRVAGVSRARTVALRLASLIPPGAVVVVAYSKPASPVSRLYYTGNLHRGARFPVESGHWAHPDGGGGVWGVEVVFLGFGDAE